MTLFNFFTVIVFFKQIKYESTKICPHIFRHALLHSLTLWGLVDSPVFYNLWLFAALHSLNETYLNSSVHQLHLSNYNYRLSGELVHPLVFERLRIISVAGSIAHIELRYCESRPQIKVSLTISRNFDSLKSILVNKMYSFITHAVFCQENCENIDINLK
jgi:hypothetical protein